MAPTREPRHAAAQAAYCNEARFPGGACGTEYRNRHWRCGRAARPDTANCAQQSGTLRQLGRERPHLRGRTHGRRVQAAFSADMRSEEFQAFMDQILELERTIDGAATFATIEGQVALSLTADSNGRVRVAGEALDSPGRWQSVDVPLRHGSHRTSRRFHARSVICWPPIPLSRRPMPDGTLASNELTASPSELA